MTVAWQGVAKEKGQELRILRELKRCREDHVYAINTYFQIFETRPQYGIGWKPFKLRPRQVELVEMLDRAYREVWPELVVEKCRDQGGTLVFLAWCLIMFLLEEHFSAIIGSRKEDMVRLMPGHDTLFAKLNDFLTHLPDWLLPEGYDPEEHFRKMKLFNPANGNTITGDSCTDDFGVGGRSSVIFRDESARWPIDTSQNTRHTAQLQVDISTVYGLNHFYDQAKAAEEYGRLFVFRWQDNPNFTKEWYYTERKLAEAKSQLHIFKREVDRDYRAAIEGQVYPGIFSVPVGDYPYNPAWPVWTAWDFGWTDMGIVLFIQQNPATGDLYLIDEVYMNKVGVEWFVPFIPGKFLPASVNPYVYSPEHLAQQARHRTWGKRNMKHFGDPSGDQHTAAQGISVFDVLRPHKITITCKSGANNMPRRQQAAGEALTRLHIDSRCTYFIDSFTQYVVPERDPNSQATTPQPKGVHKWSHAPAAFEYFALSEPLPGYQQEQNSNLIKELMYQEDEWETF